MPRGTRLILACTVALMAVSCARGEEAAQKPPAPGDQSGRATILFQDRVVEIERTLNDPNDLSESQAIELLLAHSAGYVELFYGRPRNQSSWELVTDALARSKSGMLVGGAKRLYGIVEGGDLAYVEERVDADGGLVPHLSARLTRFVG